MSSSQCHRLRKLNLHLWCHPHCGRALLPSRINWFIENVLNVVDEFFVNSDNPPVADLLPLGRPVENLFHHALCSYTFSVSAQYLITRLFCKLMVFFLHIFASVWSVMFVLCLLAFLLYGFWPGDFSSFHVLWALHAYCWFAASCISICYD